MCCLSVQHEHPYQRRNRLSGLCVQARVSRSLDYTSDTQLELALVGSPLLCCHLGSPDHQWPLKMVACELMPQVWPPSQREYKRQLQL
jgi:hypothetical protein